MNPAPLADPAIVAFARRILAARQSRYEEFPDVDFADAEWGILLDLFIAAEEGKNVSLSSLVISAAVPKTTALRAVNELVANGHLTREQDPRDGRRSHAFLTPKMHERLYHLVRRLMAASMPNED